MYSKIFQRTLTYNYKYLFPVYSATAYTIIQNRDKCALFLEKPGTEVTLRGNYENQIRRFSTIEKIYEVFASKRIGNGVVRMTWYDLLKACVPFNFSLKEESDVREHVESNPPETIISMFDLGEDGSISITDYCMFFIFHESSVGAIKKFFNPNEEDEHCLITKKRMLEFFHMRADQIKFGVRSTIQPDGRAGKVTKEEFETALNQFLKKFYNEKEEMHLHHQVDLKLKVREEVYRYEFNTFKVENGTISSDDFMKSVIAYQDKRSIRKLMNLDTKLNHDQRTDFKDFCNFKNFMMDNYKDFDKIFEEQGMVTKKKYKKILNNLTTKYNNPLTDQQQDTLFQILDYNDNNKIEVDEFNSVLINLRHLGRNFSNRVNQESLAPIFDIKQEFYTWVDKAQRILEIINE